MKKVMLQVPLDAELHRRFLLKVAGEEPRTFMAEKVREWIVAYLQEMAQSCPPPGPLPPPKAPPTSTPAEPENPLVTVGADTESKVDRLLTKIL